LALSHNGSGRLADVILLAGLEAAQLGSGLNRRAEGGHIVGALHNIIAHGAAAHQA